MKKIEEIRSYCLNCKNSQCRIKGCPLGNCIPEFIHEIDSKKAYEILCNTTILPAICGRICPHEKQCEGSCIRGIKGEPVSIGAMEAYIGDLSIENNYELSIEVDERAKDKRVAVIGSGPAGLTCAAFLARRGVKVTIYEKHDNLGGLLTHGIPEFRLPREVVEKTIEKILTDVLKEKIVLNDENCLGNKLNFLSDDKYVMAVGTADAIKNKSDISGDSVLNIRLKDGKYLLAISDGMGSGHNAKESSSKSLKMLENLLLAGFQKEKSLELINTSLINQNKEAFATLDIAIIDLYKGNIEFIKSGACPTYIKKGDKVQILKANSLPVGIVPNANLQVYDRDIDSNEIMLMCTDGVLDSNVEYKNKELWLRYILEDIETTNTKKIADLVLNEAVDNNYGFAKDDMTVLVCRFLKK